MKGSYSFIWYLVERLITQNANQGPSFAPRHLRLVMIYPFLESLKYISSKNNAYIMSLKVRSKINHKFRQENMGWLGILNMNSRNPTHWIILTLCLSSPHHMGPIHWCLL